MATLRLLFSRDTEDNTAAITTSNYVITGGSYPITVSAAVRRSGKIVDLTTSEFTTGQTYTVTVSNLVDTNGKPIKSTSVTATFTGVGVAPQVSSASAVDGTHVDVVFDEDVESTTAEDVTHYAITGASTPSVSAASLDGDGVTVHLTLSTSMITGDYTVTVIHVTDLVDNVVDPAHDTAPW